MAEVVIYTSRWCFFCTRAKQLLDSKGMTYTELSVDGEPELRADMVAKAGRTSVPQIWIGDHHVGGCDDLFALERTSALDALLS
ncbi:MAG: glutaredoxin 3 [Luminiphilus sp.]|nr:glutaredoxin 3 [Luminiphilus sp.]